MRIAIISDIHGSRFALDAALGDVRNRSVDKIVCLGDAVQGGPQPKETVERLRGMKIPTVMGNADAWLLSKEADTAEPTSEAQRQVRLWTLSKLSRADLAFIGNFKPTVEIPLGRKQRLICFHGSPRSYDEVLRPDTPPEKWDQALGEYSPAIMAGGHTHTQQIRRVRGGLFINPGSVGVVFNTLLPDDEYHLDPWAEYAILEYEGGMPDVEFRRVPYSVSGLTRVIKNSARPHADRMISGYVH